MESDDQRSRLKSLVQQMEWRVVPLSKGHVQALIEEGFNAYYSAPAGKVATALLTFARRVLDEATPGRRNEPEVAEARAPICRIAPLEEAMTHWVDGDEEGRRRVLAILDAMGAKDPAARAAHAVLSWAAQIYELARSPDVHG
ncbi:uncharacterized protein SOCEGT47_060390 [Sorangium cellulosum]|uniref:Uncharacterized protein n=1 Tax=Sorangium cellulosum TaxID=56 RepID=A0A4V0NEA5_SORCE|nr:hypothetical protein [Sorangium cellulosum]AUX25492.1 uncharacterized protein SOCEGT47_060390 [Sorangium cellulosum]